MSSPNAIRHLIEPLGFRRLEASDLAHVAADAEWSTEALRAYIADLRGRGFAKGQLRNRIRRDVYDEALAVEFRERVGEAATS